jgi:hypothetical protein
MKTKAILIGGLAIACVVAGVVFARRQAAREAAFRSAIIQADLSRANKRAVSVAGPETPQPLPPQEVATFADVAPQTKLVEAGAQPRVKPQTIAHANQPHVQQKSHSRTRWRGQL